MIKDTPLETIENFIKAVENERHDKVIEKFYTDDASIQENQNEPRVGKEHLIKNKQNMLNKALVVNSKCIRPIFQTGNQVILIICLILFTALIGCKKDVNICKKYLQKKYTNVNVEHERLYNEGKIDEAISMAEASIKKDSNNYIAISYLAVYKYAKCQKSTCSLKEWKEIYDLNKKSIGLCSNFRKGYFNIIEVLSDLSFTKYQNDHEIIEYLELYNSRFKKESNLLTVGGEAMFRLGKIEESLKYLNEAIDLDSTAAMAYVFKGKCFISLEELDKALEFLNQGLQYDSLSLGFHERGYVNHKLGNVKEAIQDYDTAIILFDERFESFIGLGQIEIDRKNFDAACHYFYHAEELEDETKRAQVWLDKYCGKRI